MMEKRTIEDRLREEYFQLLPDIRRVAEHVETEVRYCVLPISLTLRKYERLVVTSRIKECESALDSLRRRQEGATFDRTQPTLYTLTKLNDLAGVRVLAPLLRSEVTTTLTQGDVWGTLKVLLEAKAQGLTTTIEPLIERLKEAGMWISDDIQRRILTLSRERMG